MAKKGLLATIFKAASDTEYVFDKESKTHVKDFVTSNLDYSRTVEAMEKIDRQIRDEKFDEADFSFQEKQYEDAKQSFWSHLKENSQSLFSGNFIDSVKNLRDDAARHLSWMLILLSFLSCLGLWMKRPSRLCWFR